MVDKVMYLARTGLYYSNARRKHCRLPVSKTSSKTVLLLLFLSGDVHFNPGHPPTVCTSLSVTHFNLNGILSKIHLVETKCCDCDIIIITGTQVDWDIHNVDIVIKRFKEPCRKDRTYDNWGGVKITLYLPTDQSSMFSVLKLSGSNEIETSAKLYLILFIVFYLALMHLKFNSGIL